MLGGCGQASVENSGPIISVNEEDQELLDEIGDDIHVVDPADFAETAESFGEENVGEVYQLTGYYIVAKSENEQTDCLCDGSTEPSVALMLRYLETELTEGDCYTVTGIVALEEHGDHSHIVFDVITVESYAEN